MSKIHIFVSYSRRDERWVKKGEHGLIPWLAQSLTRKDVEIWYDHALREMPGEDYKRKIKEEIDRAQFAILLISQEFLSSDFIRRYEMPWIKERVDRDEMTIIPILVDYTVWDLEDEFRWIADRQMLPGSPTPLIEHTESDPQWSRVRSQILQAILHRIQEVQKSAAKSDADLGMGAKPAASEVEEARQKTTHQQEEEERGGFLIVERGDNAVLAAQEGDAQEEDTPGLTADVTGSVHTLSLATTPVVGEWRTLGKHGGWVNSVAVTPDGRRMVSAAREHSASGGETLKVWDLRTGMELRTLSGHVTNVTRVALYANGQRAISASQDRALKVWNLDSGKLLQVLTGHSGAVWGVDVYARGRRAISASSDHTLKIWDLESGQELRTLTGHDRAVTDVVVYDDGRRAISTSQDQNLLVWDLEEGTALRTLRGHRGWVSPVAVYANGRRAVSCSRDRTLIVWDLKTGTALHILRGHSAWVTRVVVFADGKRALSAATPVVSRSRDPKLIVWDLETGTALHILRGLEKGAFAMAVCLDGRRAITVGSDNILRVWDIEGEDVIATIEAEFDRHRHLWCAAIEETPDGLIVVAGSGMVGGEVHFLRLEDI